jgi:uncharacterized beta-barrel protein YwiB (DUF1934 family)
LYADIKIRESNEELHQTGTFLKVDDNDVKSVKSGDFDTGEVKSGGLLNKSSFVTDSKSIKK